MAVVERVPAATENRAACDPQSAGRKSAIDGRSASGSLALAAGGHRIFPIPHVSHENFPGLSQCHVEPPSGVRRPERLVLRHGQPICSRTYFPTVSLLVKGRIITRLPMPRGVATDHSLNYAPINPDQVCKIAQPKYHNQTYNIIGADLDTMMARSTPRTRKKSLYDEGHSEVVQRPEGLWIHPAR
jgi:hypothetical protein